MKKITYFFAFLSVLFLVLAHSIAWISQGLINLHFGQIFLALPEFSKAAAAVFGFLYAHFGGDIFKFKN